MARIIVGLKWKCSPNRKNRCAECSAMDGREFYYKPEGGQSPVERMKEPPIHPNCTCTRVPIFRYGELSKFFGKGGFEYPPGVAWSSDGLGLEGFAQYGNYGGPGWTMGRNEANLRGDEKKPKPIDAMDACFMRHDNRYTMCAITDMGHEKTYNACLNDADQKLVLEMQILPANVDDWGGRPKTTSGKIAALAYRYVAHIGFMERISHRLRGGNLTVPTDEAKDICTFCGSC